MNGQLYEFNHVMPSLVNNKTLTEEDIADIISYVSNAFSDGPKGLTKKDQGASHRKAEKEF